MMSRLIRWAREGSIATLTIVTMASAPTAAQAGWFDDVKNAVGALGAVLNPSHDIGKFALGSVMVGGGAAVLASADLAVAAGAAAIVGTAITGGAVLLIVAGAGLAIWGGYKLWKSFNGKDEGPTPTAPTRPGAGSGDPGRPGRIDPGRESGPGAGTPGSGTGTLPGGSSTTPGSNTDRRPGLRPGDMRPRTAPGAAGANGAGTPSGGVLPR